MFGKSAAPLAWVWCIAQRLCNKLRAFFYDRPESGKMSQSLTKENIYIFFYSVVSNCCYRLAKEYYIIIPSLPTLPEQTVVKINFHLAFVKNYEGAGRRASWLSERETSKLSEWLSGGTSVRSICSQGDESEQRGAGSRTAKSTQGQQMTAANWKTNEVNKSNLDSGVAVYLRVDTEGKLHERLWIYFVLMQFSHMLCWPRFWLV